MEYFLPSLHSIGALIPGLMSLSLALFLLFKKDKTTPTVWLGGMFLGYASLFFGYFASYTFFHEVAAYHRIFSVAIVFGLWAMIGFSYTYPRNVHIREFKIVMPLTFIIALGGWAHFVVATWNMEKYFQFDAHLYTFLFGREASLVILLLMFFFLQILLRKALLFSEYKGPLYYWTKTGGLARRIVGRFLLFWHKLVLPRGRDARACRDFFLGGIFMVIVGVLNALQKSGRLSYDTYGILFGTITILAFFYIFLVYINNSPEPTTFMVKLVGISAVALLLVFSLGSYITLYLNEAAYDRERLTEVRSERTLILRGEFQEVSPAIQYVMVRPDEPGLFSERYRIAFNRGTLDLDAVKSGEAFLRKNLALEYSEKIKGTYKDLKGEALVARAFELLGQEAAPVMQRRYRIADKFYTHYDFLHQGLRYEVGYSYNDYRRYVSVPAMRLMALILFSSLLMVIIFPLFFRTSLVAPLNRLLRGVQQVNEGNLNVNVPIDVPDEIGYLSQSFNGMVSTVRHARERMQEYADSLEHRVERRTRELNERMQEVERLKIQQDGDYFLTSLLARPLFFNFNKSKKVPSEFIIRQKKQFEFRGKEADLGGDICVTGNLRFGDGQNFVRHTMVMNGDAMGKSMQGAGGSLVMGVVMNSIMARSAANDRILTISPEQWLTDLYNEIHAVFKSFDGSMVISATCFIINDDTGEAWYWNAEHPFSVIYRNGRASFIEETLRLRKLGLDSELPFEVFRFQFQPGDVLILGSDGRDDLDMTADEEHRTINEDEFLFLRHVEDGFGQLELIEKMILRAGELTDDLSLLRVEFQPAVTRAESRPEEFRSLAESLFRQGKQLYKDGRMDDALRALSNAFIIYPEDPQINKMLAIMSFKSRDYRTSIEVLQQYLSQEPDLAQFWYYLSIAEKAVGNYAEALRAAEQVAELEPDNLNNLINMADLCRLLHKYNNARLYADDAYSIDPENKNVQKIRTMVMEKQPELSS